MKIEDLAQKWKKFEAYQDRIHARNINSDEYHEFVKVKNEPSVWTSSIWALRLQFIAEKDMYPKSIEGMLKWINDGEKD